MKRVLSLVIFFLIIFNMMAPSMATDKMYKVSVSESSGATVLDAGNYKEGEEVTSTAEDFYIPYHAGYTLLKSGRLKKFADKNRIISEKIQVDKESIYYFKNLSAKYGNCFYVIYNSNDEVINYQVTNESSTGDVIEYIKVIMPENASYFRLACDLNVNNKMFEAAKSNKESDEKIKEPAIISFIDDDCKEEVYENLYPLIKDLNLPYTLACPPNSLDNEGYITTDQLKELYANGVDIVSHHLKEYAMTEFDSIEAYEKDTKDCLEKFKNMGIEVSGVAYPNGRINDDYMSVVKEYYKYGFTTDRAINTLPYESCYIHRCEVFPKSGIYNIEDAKALVKSVAENGGWLVFMTHCAYETFSADGLAELVDCIRENNIEILNVTDVIENYANTIDIGIVKKPLTDMAEDFFIVDCMGRAYTNNVEINNIETDNITIIEKSPIKWDEISIDYNIASSLRASGSVDDRYENLKNLSEEEQILQKKRNVSEKIYVTPNSIYKLANMSAKYGKCFYVIYDSDNNVIDYQRTLDSSTGETLDEIIITMPSNASYFRMACDLNVNNKMFKAYRKSDVNGAN